MYVKLAVWAHPDGRLRFNALASDSAGQHEAFDARYDLNTRITTLEPSDLGPDVFDPSTPLFYREYFGHGGTFELFGHLCIQNGGNTCEFLQSFSARVFAAVTGSKNQCVDDPNRAVFWKAVDFLATSGPLDLSCVSKAFAMTAPISPRFDF